MMSTVSVKMSSSLSPRLVATVSGSPNPRKGKYKPRASLACDTCRAKKSNCDQGFPCQICIDMRSTFVFGLAWYDLCWTIEEIEKLCYCVAESSLIFADFGLILVFL
jgi:Fungal Zn(2)-Cys(6) binuclear cluster domain